MSMWTAIVLIAIAAMATSPVARVTMVRPVALAGELPPAQTGDLLQVLLKNVYRAFDFREEEDVYDKLAISVDGELLADIYLQNRRSFAVQQAGGAQAKIKSVEILDAVAERAGWGRPAPAGVHRGLAVCKAFASHVAACATAKWLRRPMPARGSRRSSRGRRLTAISWSNARARSSWN